MENNFIAWWIPNQMGHSSTSLIDIGKAACTSAWNMEQHAGCFSNTAAL
jgi:hypothetical protein